MWIWVIGEPRVVQDEYGFDVVNSLKHFTERNVTTGQRKFNVVLSDDHFEARLRAGGFAVNGERVPVVHIHFHQTHSRE